MEKDKKGIETIHERIAFLVKEFGKGRNTKFANLVGTSEGNIRGYINKGVMPKQDILEKMVTRLGINAKWLLTGEGPLMPEPVVQPKSELISVPLVDISAAAGVGGYENGNYLEVDDYIELPTSMLRRADGYYCIRVKGESMSPTMLDSGYLIIRLLNRADWGYIKDNYAYVVTTREGGTYVKRLRNRLVEKGFVVCTSDNPDKQAYPNFNLYENEIHNIFSVEWYFTAKMPNIQETYYKRIDDLELKYDELKDEVDEIRSRMAVRK